MKTAITMTALAALLALASCELAGGPELPDSTQARARTMTPIGPDLAPADTIGYAVGARITSATPNILWLEEEDGTRRGWIDVQDGAMVFHPVD